MRVCNVAPRWIDEHGRARRFRTRLHWHVACALASMQRHDGVLLPCHVEALRRMRSRQARAWADVFERLAALQRDRERARPPDKRTAAVEDAAAVQSRDT